MDDALAPLRLQGIRILNYINDWLILAQSEDMEVMLVVEAQCQEEFIVSPADNYVFEGSVGLYHDAGTTVSSSNRGCFDYSQQHQARPSHCCQTLSESAWASGLLYMRPIQWWLRTWRFSPRGNLFCMIKVAHK